MNEPFTALSQTHILHSCIEAYTPDRFLPIAAHLAKRHPFRQTELTYAPVVVQHVSQRNLLCCAEHKQRVQAREEEF